MSHEFLHTVYVLLSGKKLNVNKFANLNLQFHLTAIRKAYSILTVLNQTVNNMRRLEDKNFDII